MNYGYYDNLRNTSQAIRHAKNIDVYIDPNTNKEIGICHLNGYIWISDDGIDPDINSIDSIAASLMAMHHFNTGQGIIAPEIQDIHTKCPVRFTSEFADTTGDEFEALAMMANVVGGGNGASLPCGILGATRSATTQPMALLSASYDLPQMSWEATSDELSNKEVYPLFSRVLSANSAMAEAAYQHLGVNLNAGHCAVLYLNDGYGISFLRTFQAMAQVGGMKTLQFAYTPSFNEEEIRLVMEGIKATGYRYIFCIIYPEHLKAILTEAAKQGITGDDYFWFIGNEPLFSEMEVVEENSWLDKAYHGVGFLQVTPGREGQGGGYDSFLSAWRNLDSEAKAHFDSIMPKYPTSDTAKYNYTNYPPIGWSMFAYDTVIAMGLAACEAMDDEEEFFGGEEVHKSLKDVVFHGASGLVRFNNETATRLATSSLIEVLNLRRNNATKATGYSYYELVPSTALQPNEDGSAWEFARINPFFYADGSTTPPPDLPPINGGKGVNYNYIGDLRIMGYVLFGIIAISSIVFAAWTVFNRKTRVVKASQPPFLVMICKGVLIMASSIITLSIDDQYFSEQAASIACMTSPWLLSTGFSISFAALFSKTWRINKVLNNPRQFRRVTVRLKDVLGPFIIFFMANTTILTCWTVLAPLEYSRSVYGDGTDEFNRPISSYGLCTTVADAPISSQLFGSCLLILNSVIVIFATYQAYRARNISTDYSESKYIAYCIVSQLQALIMGVPIIALLSQNADAHRTTFLVQTLIIFIVSMAILILMFVPKILQARNNSKRPQLTVSSESPSFRVQGGLHFSINSTVRRTSNGVLSVSPEEIGMEQSNEVAVDDPIQEERAYDVKFGDLPEAPLRHTTA